MQFDASLRLLGNR